MFPFLNIFGLKIPMYGIMTAAAYALGIWYCLKRRHLLGLTKDQVLDIIFYLIVGAALGGKLFFIIFYWPDFVAASIMEKIRYGFVFLGGFTGACIAGIYILTKMKIPVLRGADFFVQVVPLGHSVGKIGCFLAGCCYGRVSNIPFLSVKYHNHEGLVPGHLHGVGLYPVQLIEAAITLCLFFVLYAMSKREHKPGSIIAAYMIGFGIVRFIAEFFRGEEEVYILGITQNQIAALGLILFALAFIWWRNNYYVRAK